jgi:UDPglucose 6-dehydrogenase
MRVAVIGSGYAGLSTGIGLAEIGHHVVCVDIDAAKVVALNAGDPVIFEAGIELLLREHLSTGRFRATTELAQAVAGSEITFICVGTPADVNGDIDTSYVVRAAEQVGAILGDVPDFHVVVVKSTVVPGTTQRVLLPAIEGASGKRAGEYFGIAVNPEFLTEGQALEDFMAPDRLVIGGDTRSLDVLRRLYEPFVGVPIVATNAPTAEMIKYASNAMLATAISFANEIANIGSTVGDIDAAEVMRGVHLSRYLTSRQQTGYVTAELARFFEAGCGFGGSCLPKDVTALSTRARALGYQARLLDAVTAVNTEQPRRLVDLVCQELGPLHGRRVAVLGLAFKPDTDDVRCSPAFPVIRGLLDAGADVIAHDPVVGEAALDCFSDESVVYLGDLTLVLKAVEAVVLVTRWDDYRALPELLREVEVEPLVVDGRRMLDRRLINRYRGIGL